MSNELEELLRSKVDWQKTQESPYLFKASYNGKKVRLRLNDFPQEPAGTLFIDTHEIHTDEFPDGWTLPRHRGE